MQKLQLMSNFKSEFSNQTLLNEIQKSPIEISVWARKCEVKKEANSAVTIDNCISSGRIRNKERIYYLYKRDINQYLRKN